VTHQTPPSEVVGVQSSDAELVAAACLGDQASFGLLYERHYRLAVGIARSRIADCHLAEDAAQEAFAIVCRALPSLHDPGRFPQWLGTICRRTGSRLSVDRPTHEPLPEELASADDSNLKALRLQVQDALGSLDETAREIVVLHYFSGLSYQQISQALGLSAQSVHGRLQRARNKLFQILGTHDSSGVKP
jgi:RNA polymerase sigma-70 factor (ECF subfamily)